MDIGTFARKTAELTLLWQNGKVTNLGSLGGVAWNTPVAINDGVGFSDLVGDEDGSTPVDLVKETAALIPGSRFEIVQGAGHLPNVEKPEIVARLVAEHAKRAVS